MASPLVPLTLAMAALTAGTAGLRGLALWIGLLTVPAAAAVAFAAISDALDGRPALLRASTSGAGLGLVVLASAVRENTPTGAGVSPLASWALLAALLAYASPAVVWVLEPVRIPRRSRPQRRLRRAEVDELLSRAA